MLTVDLGLKYHIILDKTVETFHSHKSLKDTILVSCRLSDACASNILEVEGGRRYYLC